MMPILYTPTPRPQTLRPPSEAEIIHRRVASARKWRRRHCRLQLAAVLFGRRKHRRPKLTASPDRHAAAALPAYR